MEGLVSAARVLVVDDDAAALEATTTMLSLSGFEVRGAHNGAVGLEQVLTFRPEVVVFDFWMPVSDGRELLQGIREVARERLGLVAISGTPEVEDWCARVGVQQFVRKPFDKQSLVDAVNRALEEARIPSSRGRIASGPPPSTRLRVDRAVLLVGSRDAIRPVRSLLRDHERPMQVAVVDAVEDALRALSSFMLDAVAVCGAANGDRHTLVALLAEASARGLPVIVDARNEVEPPNGARVELLRDPTPDALVRAIHLASGHVTA